MPVECKCLGYFLIVEIKNMPFERKVERLKHALIEQQLDSRTGEIMFSLECCIRGTPAELETRCRLGNSVLHMG